MREIKFKIWYPDSKIMDGPFDIDLFFIKNSVHPRFDSSDRHYYLQFTDLYDKNGKEIWEGDILKRMPRLSSFDVGILGIVEYRPGGFFNKYLRITFDPVEGKPDDGIWIVGHNSGDYVVIGNIYQNPELLEENKNV